MAEVDFQKLTELVFCILYSSAFKFGERGEKERNIRAHWLIDTIIH